MLCNVRTDNELMRYWCLISSILYTCSLNWVNLCPVTPVAHKELTWKDLLIFLIWNDLVSLHPVNRCIKNGKDIGGKSNALLEDKEINCRNKSCKQYLFP